MIIRVNECLKRIGILLVDLGLEVLERVCWVESQFKPNSTSLQIGSFNYY